ncbi:unnamed protein product [Linum trigynum]|uniref:Dehydrin n=1 Tax=Linum trigynum TaxID=586398 RepID=A0AAV2FIU1_9ROSI
MADPNLYHHPACAGNGCGAEQEKEPTAGGLCGLLMKKVGGGGHHDEHKQTPSDVAMADIEHQEVKHGGNPTLADQLHRSDCGGSSSEEEEEGGEIGEKKRKKRGMKERIKKKLSGEKEEEDHHFGHQQEQPEIIITGDDDDKANDAANQATLIQMHEDDSEEKKGFIEKMMDKLPLYGQEMKKPGDEDHVDIESGAAQPEKGILDKIKDKIPGSHKNGGDHEAKKED